MRTKNMGLSRKGLPMSFAMTRYAQSYEIMKRGVALIKVHMMNIGLYAIVSKSRATILAVPLISFPDFPFYFVIKTYIVRLFASSTKPSRIKKTRFSISFIGLTDILMPTVRLLRHFNSPFSGNIIYTISLVASKLSFCFSLFRYGFPFFLASYPWALLSFIPGYVAFCPSRFCRIVAMGIASWLSLFIDGLNHCATAAGAWDWGQSGNQSLSFKAIGSLTLCCSLPHSAPMLPPRLRAVKEVM